MDFPITNTSKGKFISYPTSNKCACCDNIIKDDDFICFSVASGKGDLLMDIAVHLESRNIYGGVQVLNLNNTESIDIYVCSSKCLRSFFNGICDEVDKDYFPEEVRDKKLSDIGI